jgi:FtsH-binding integral membrane protein
VGPARGSLCLDDRLVPGRHQPQCPAEITEQVVVVGPLYVTVSMYTITQQNPKYDLSQWGATLSSWMSILLVYLLIGVAQNVGWLPAGFLPYSDMLYSLFAVCLFTLFLAHHTKLIVGGKHSKYQMNDKDYVFGAMALYVDIVNIFLHILQLIGRERE